MTLFQAIILGIVQGISESLPISSSGHLILVPTLLGWNLQSLSFDVALHIGTVLAILVYFFEDWKNMFVMLYEDVVFSGALLKDRSTKNLRYESRQLLIIGVVIMPVAIAGYFLESPIENLLRSPIVVSVMLILVAILMYISDRYSIKQERYKKDITFIDALVISVSQILALIPGTSRSGITITTGLFRGLDRQNAARFSFLLATPLILGAGILKLPDLFTNGSEPIAVILTGILTSFIVGLLSIRFLLNFVRNHSLNLFIIYRILLGIFIIAVLSL